MCRGDLITPCYLSIRRTRPGPEARRTRSLAAGPTNPHTLTSQTHPPETPSQNNTRTRRMARPPTAATPGDASGYGTVPGSADTCRRRRANTCSPTRPLAERTAKAGVTAVGGPDRRRVRTLVRRSTEDGARTGEREGVEVRRQQWERRKKRAGKHLQARDRAALRTRPVEVVLAGGPPRGIRAQLVVIETSGTGGK